MPLTMSHSNSAAAHSTNAVSDSSGQNLNWAPQDDVSPTQQFQLPESFFTDWPFDVGQGEAFDFLSDVQATNNNGGSGGGGGSSGTMGNGNGMTSDTSGIQDILGVGMPEGFVGAGQIGGVLGSMGFTSGS